MNISIEVQQFLNFLQQIPLKEDMFDPKNPMKKFYELKTKAKHGSPLDRGSADRYYGRPYDPHYWPMGTNNGIKIEAEQMDPLQIAQYTFGYENETDRKNWG